MRLRVRILGASERQEMTFAPDTTVSQCLKDLVGRLGAVAVSDRLSNVVSEGASTNDGGFCLFRPPRPNDAAGTFLSTTMTLEEAGMEEGDALDLKCQPKLLYLHLHRDMPLCLTSADLRGVDFKTLRIDFWEPLHEFQPTIASALGISGNAVEYGYAYVPRLNKGPVRLLNVALSLDEQQVESPCHLMVFPLPSLLNASYRLLARSAAANPFDSCETNLAPNKEGWLLRGLSHVKRGKLEKRWAVLAGPILYFFKKKRDPESRPLELVSLDHMRPPGQRLPRGGGSSKQKDGVVEIFLEKDISVRSFTPHMETLVMHSIKSYGFSQWVHHIRMATFAYARKRIFGVPLRVLAFRPEYMEQRVPNVIWNCISFLEQQDRLEQEGLFRISATAQDLLALKNAYDTGLEPSFDDSPYAHHVASGLLKLYLRELPEPLLLEQNYEALVEIGNAALVEDGHIEQLKAVVHALPGINFAILRTLCFFFAVVAQYAEKNMMTSENVARIIGPNILRSSTQDLLASAANATNTYKVVQLLMEERERIFNVSSEQANRERTRTLVSYRSSAALPIPKVDLPRKNSSPTSRGQTLKPRSIASPSARFSPRSTSTDFATSPRSPRAIFAAAKNRFSAGGVRGRSRSLWRDTLASGEAAEGDGVDSTGSSPRDDIYLDQSTSNAGLIRRLMSRVADLETRLEEEARLRREMELKIAKLEDAVSSGPSTRRRNSTRHIRKLHRMSPSSPTSHLEPSRLPPVPPIMMTNATPIKSDAKAVPAHLPATKVKYSNDEEQSAQDKSSAWVTKWPFHAAVQSGLLTLTRKMLDGGEHQGAVNQYDSDGWVPLHYAAFYGHADVLRLLLEAGAACRLPAKQNGSTALHLAAGTGHAACVEELLRHDPSLKDVQNKEKQTAAQLCTALRPASEKEVQRLLAM